MKLNRQQKAVYDFILAHPACTVQQIREATLQRKPDMRISEINYSYQLEHEKGIPNLKDDAKNLIVNVGRNKYREVLKSVRAPLTRTVSKVEIVDGIAVEKRVQEAL